MLRRMDCGAQAMADDAQKHIKAMGYTSEDDRLAVMRTHLLVGLVTLKRALIQVCAAHSLVGTACAGPVGRRYGGLHYRRCHVKSFMRVWCLACRVIGLSCPCLALCTRRSHARDNALVLVWTCRGTCLQAKKYFPDSAGSRASAQQHGLVFVSLQGLVCSAEEGYSVLRHTKFKVLRSNAGKGNELTVIRLRNRDW